MKILATLFLFLMCVPAWGTSTPPQPLPGPSVSIFSTTVDWEAVTGLTLHQYTGKITGGDRSFVKDGLVLYYLDSFPCYGEADSVRVWLSPNGKMVGNLRIVCIHKPEKILFAWRNATEDATQARSTGVLTCPVDGKRHFTIDILTCEIGPNWTEYK